MKKEGVGFDADSDSEIPKEFLCSEEVQHVVTRPHARSVDLADLASLLYQWVR